MLKMSLCFIRFPTDNAAITSLVSKEEEYQIFVEGKEVRCLVDSGERTIPLDVNLAGSMIRVSVDDTAPIYVIQNKQTENGVIRTITPLTAITKVYNFKDGDELMSLQNALYHGANINDVLSFMKV